MREIRNYVRIGNWCDSAAIYIYMYAYIYTEILFENKQWTNFLLGDATGCGEYTVVMKNERQTGRGTIKSLE